MILVTGGTGLVGAHLLYNLIKKGESVRAIYRNEKKCEQVKHIFSYYSDDAASLYEAIDWFQADLNDIPLLSQAFQGIENVYHCAAFVSFEPDKFELLKRSNIEGTANIVNLCLANAVKKLCHVSSIAAIGKPKSGVPTTEDTEWNAEADNNGYAITKYGAELEVWRGTQEGLDAVIVNPGVIIGPGLWRYGSGAIIKTVHKGLSFYTKGSMGYISVEDVVKSMCYLMDSQIKNERYILVSEHWTYEELFKTCSEALAVKAPQKEAKSGLLKWAWRMDWLKHKLGGKRRLLTKHLAQTLLNQVEFDTSKLQSQTEIKFSALEQSIKQTCALYLKDIS